MPHQPDKTPLDIHTSIHVTDWAHGGHTDLDSLASLCWVHHRQVDLHHWRLTRNNDPHGPHWTVTPIPRHAWRKRRAE